MSYLHCPTCSHAFNLAVTSQCPYCPVPASIVEPVEDIVMLADALARAMERASPEERESAAARIGAPLVAQGSGPVKAAALPPVTVWMLAAESFVDLVGRASDIERRIVRRLEKAAPKLIKRLQRRLAA